MDKPSRFGFIPSMAPKKKPQPTATISFKSEQEKQDAHRKAKVRHASFSHCARELFKNFKP